MRCRARTRRFKPRWIQRRLRRPVELRSRLWRLWRRCRCYRRRRLRLGWLAWHVYRLMTMRTRNLLPSQFRRDQKTTATHGARQRHRSCRRSSRNRRCARCGGRRRRRGEHLRRWQRHAAAAHRTTDRLPGETAIGLEQPGALRTLELKRSHRASSVHFAAGAGRESSAPIVACAAACSMLRRRGVALRRSEVHSNAASGSYAPAPCRRRFTNTSLSSPGA